MEKFKDVIEKLKDTVSSIFSGNKGFPPLLLRQEKDDYDSEDENDFEQEENSKLLNSPWLWAAAGLTAVIGIGALVGWLTSRRTIKNTPEETTEIRTVQITESSNSNSNNIINNDKQQIILQSLSTLLGMVQNIGTQQQISQIQTLTNNLNNNNIMNNNNNNNNINQIPLMHQDMQPKIEIIRHSTHQVANDPTKGGRYSTDSEIFTGRNQVL